MPQEPFALDTAPEEAACIPRTHGAGDISRGGKLATSPSARRRDKGLALGTGVGSEDAVLDGGGRFSLPGQLCLAGLMLGLLSVRGRAAWAVREGFHRGPSELWSRVR